MSGQPSASARAGAAPAPTADVKVWDIFVRVFHWTVVVGFFIAYFTEDDLLTLHVWAGYVIGVLVLMRLVWGFVGPKHARFADFVYRPAKVWRYARDLISSRAERHIGHSPLGGAMIMVLLAGLLATVWSGLELYAIEENAGPLATVAEPQATTAARPTGGILLVSGDDHDDERSRYGEHGKEGEEFWEETHEFLANVVLFLVILHVGGVIVSSFAHHENLIRAMVTGRKRRE